MRILNEYDREITPVEVNGEEGYLELELLTIAHHDAQEEVPEEAHYAVKAFNFSDGTSYIPTSEEDPHIDPIDADAGLFQFNPCGQSSPSIASIDIDRIVDVPYCPAQEAWDETEYIERYKLFTDKELKENRQREAETEAYINFIKTGEKRMAALEARVKELEEKLAQLDK